MIAWIWTCKLMKARITVSASRSIAELKSDFPEWPRFSSGLLITVLNISLHPDFSITPLRQCLLLKGLYKEKAIELNNSCYILHSERNVWIISSIHHVIKVISFLFGSPLTPLSSLNILFRKCVPGCRFSHYLKFREKSNTCQRPWKVQICS